MKLVIIEGVGKEATIKKYLGSEYEVVAKLISKASGAELETLTATLTIEPKHIFDEIEKDADSNIKLTYETTFVQLRKDQEDQTRLIAGGLELWAAETIYFVLDDSTMPLNFLNLDENSVEVASIVENALVISQQGTYDIVMSFPEGELVPTILVREGKDANVFYFRTPENSEANEETALGFVRDGNTVTYEATLEAGKEFLIANFYRSVEFVYNPHFVGIDGFDAANDGYVKVLETASYKFVIDLISKSIKIYKNGQLLEVDTNILYLRGSMNEWGTSTALVKKNGVASITVDLALNDEFKIADASWGVQYNLSQFGAASTYFGPSVDDGNIKVLQAGTYEIEIDLNNNTITVTKDGEVILDKVSAGSQGGNHGGGTATGIITIYFSNNKYWQGDIYVYVWANGTENKPADWPGVKMTFVEVNGYGESIYKADIDVDKYDMIIFTNGSDQTTDVAITKTHNIGYYVDGTGLGTYTYGQ